MPLKSWVIVLILSSISTVVCAQLFQNDGHKQRVKVAAKYIYNQEEELANKAMKEVTSKLPDHPMNPMMSAVYLLWQEIPMKTTDTVFQEFEKYLRETIRLADQLPDEYHDEKIFFDMSARALLAEHYADEGAYVKAINEARRTYANVKQGFDLVDENPEFLLTTGLYNYFREAYPEKYPIYKSFVWIFKNGDKEKGLEQLHRATKETIISRVEAYLYLSYIYLRYENDKYKAYEVLNELYTLFPNNNYFKVKYIEALILNDMYREAYPLILEVKEVPKTYYVASSEVFYGMYKELYEGDHITALTSYNIAISKIEELRGQGSHYISQAYLGAGRCYAKFGNKKKSREYFEKALEYSETTWVKEELEQHLATLK